jgi:hypothetical protein
MSEATIIGIDLAKRVFQLHGPATTGPWHFARSFHVVSCLRLFRSIQVALSPWKLARRRTDGAARLRSWGTKCA